MYITYEHMRPVGQPGGRAAGRRAGEAALAPVPSPQAPAQVATRPKSLCERTLGVLWEYIFADMLFGSVCNFLQNRFARSFMRRRTMFVKVIVWVTELAFCRI